MSYTSDSSPQDSDMGVEHWTVDDLWPKCPSVGELKEIEFREDDWKTEDCFATAANKLLDLNGGSNSRYARVGKSLNDASGRGVTKMDAALCFGDAPSPPKSWGSIAIPVECQNCRDPAPADAIRRLKRAAESIFGHQFRLFVWAISIFTVRDESWFQLQLYLRSGIIFSHKFKLADYFGKFLELLLGFASMSVSDLGWYLVEPNPLLFTPLFIAPYPTTTEPRVLSIPGHKLYLQRVLAVRDGIDSRGTLVLWCLTNKNEDRIVKLTWLSKRRAERYESVVRFLGTKLSRLPLVIHAGVLSMEVGSGLSEEITTGNLLSAITQPPLSLPSDWADRRLFCVIEDRLGVRIDEEKSLERLLYTFAGVAEQIGEMERIKAYHRDVSIGNIFTRQQSRPGNQGVSQGWLGDFDCAYVDDPLLTLDGPAPLRQHAPSGDEALSGTLPFMSEAVLCAMHTKQPYRQAGIDDLESLVWVLHWFFHHFKPREINKGWTSIKYNQDVASQTSVSRVFSLSSIRSSSQPTPRAVGSRNSSPNLSATAAAASSSRKRRSPNTSANTQPTKTRRLSQTTAPILTAEDVDAQAELGPPSNRSLHLEVDDPLELWLLNFESAFTSKCCIKFLGACREKFLCWNSNEVKELFSEIWMLPQWESLSGAGLKDFRRDLPTPNDGRTSLPTLVQELVLILNKAAENSPKFYRQ